MVHFKATISLLIVLATLILANPLTERDEHDDNGCIPDHVAQDLVPIFQYFFVDIDPVLANKTLTEDFQLFSDSQEFTTPGITPVSGAVIYKNRAEFIKAQLAVASPGAPNAFVTLDTFHSCNKIAFRWVAPGGFGGKYPIRGIDTLDLVMERGVWKIKADYSEYDNVAFLAGIGVCQIC